MVVISGMSAMDQVKENIELFNKINPVTDDEKTVLQKAVDSIATFIPCTSCAYCCGACPQKLDIPVLIATFNEASHEVSWYVHEVLDTLPDDKKPQACTACGACVPLCPQNIDIPGIMKEFCELLKESD